ncbi:hypothetical protein BZY51_26540 [Enterobacter hormaechei]|nr:hypothetical protein BZY51_26540 [Enterobacter hormaechei]
MSPLHFPLDVGLSCRHGEDVAAFRRGEYHDHCLPLYAPSYPKHARSPRLASQHGYRYKPELLQRRRRCVLWPARCFTVAASVT